jgi:tetratricopeptide (TPR) repeat protein
VEAAVTQGEIGYTQFYQGKFKDALLSLREAEAVLLRTEDKEIEAARTQRNIGHCLYRLSKYDDAEKEFTRAIDTLKRRLVSDHPEIAETELRLGDTFKRQSDPRATPPLPEGERKAREQQAFELFCTAQRTLEKVYGEEHELVAQACNSKGHICKTRKQYAEAKELFDRAVRILKLLHGDNPHKDIADSLNCIGVIHEDQHEWPQALDYFARARDLYCKIHRTENHIDVAACDNYAAEVYLQMKDYEGARKAAKTALETRKRHYLDPNSRQVTASETLMGRIESAIAENSRPPCQ